MTDPREQTPTYRQDAHLSEDARSYLISLRSNESRDSARDYANMDPALFRARIGPAIDELLVEMRLMRAPAFNKKQLATIATAGGFALELLLRGLDRIRPQ